MEGIRRLILGLALGAAPAAAQQTDRAFEYSAQMQPGRWVYIRNVNGAVKVEQARGATLEVTAIKRWRRGDPEAVRIEARRIGPGDRDVIVCAFWTENASCDEDGYRSRGDSRWGDRWNDVSVDFVVRLPDGVKVEAATVNGSVRVEGASSDVVARSVNGGVEAWSTGGSVDAETVNGSLDIRVPKLPAGGVSYKTVNGSITVALPASLDAELELRTVNGRLAANDFPIMISGAVNPRRLRGTIGKGGPRIALETVNGSVRLEKLP